MSGPFSFCNESEPSVAIIFVPPLLLFLSRHPILAGPFHFLHASRPPLYSPVAHCVPLCPSCSSKSPSPSPPWSSSRSPRSAVSSGEERQVAVDDVIVLLLLNHWICSCCSRMDDSQQHEYREHTMDHYRGVKELNALKVLEANIPILELNIPTFGNCASLIFTYDAINVKILQISIQEAWAHRVYGLLLCIFCLSWDSLHFLIMSNESSTLQMLNWERLSS
ncbi:hypothetical protein K1719_038921 [Acacia pycnantha]|nr:hypothetical protein K1719_038921 [Acacia pycnantha]